MNLKYINWIWHIRGKIPLPDGQSKEEAFDRLAPLFEKEGTSYQRRENILIFEKKDQAAQDKMSIFDGGLLEVSADDESRTLRYHLKSRALLTCFLAPLVFLAFAQFSVAISGLHANAEAAKRSAERSTEETKKEEDEETVRELHPIDKFLGAPAPKQPDEDKKCKADPEEDSEARESVDETDEGDLPSDASSDKGECEEEKEELKHSPTTAYVFAGIFFAVYLVGRGLEDWLIRRAFRKSLNGEGENTNSA